MTFPAYERIHLHADFTTTEVIRFMLIPNLQTFYCEGLNIMKPPRLPPAFTSANSSLTSLDLLGGTLWCIEPRTLRAMLSHCPSLRVLRCQIPMIAHLDSCQEQTSCVERPVSPRELITVLEPVRHTLQDVSLLNRRHTVPYDGSCMDFSGFAALRKLEITSCCLMPPGAPCEERDGLYKLLPRSLERLKVRTGKYTLRR